MDGMKRVPQNTKGDFLLPSSEEPVKFFELNLTIRAGSLDDVLGLLPKAIGDFIEGSTLRTKGKDELGSWCDDKSNYSYRLSEK